MPATIMGMPTSHEIAADRPVGTVITIDQFSRYAILVDEGPGVALQLVDRMAGPGPVSGEAGVRNGRVDAFLDRGSYLVRTEGIAGASETVSMQVIRFSERSSKPLELVEGRSESLELNDFEQRSWWVAIEHRRALVVRAAGRALADLRLWRDGTWLVDSKPSQERIEPRPGAPMQQLRLVATLEPGLYRLTAYGGPPLAWPDGGAEMPLHVESGVRELAVAGRSRHTISNFGSDQWLIPAPANFIRLELPEPAPATVEAQPYTPERPRFAAGARLSIDRDSRRPVAELELSPAGEPFLLVTVHATAEQEYVLQHFESADFYRFNRSGRWWLSTVSSGDPNDWLDTTAVLLRTQDRSQQLEETPWRTATVRVGPDASWSRRCNVSDTASALFVEITADGRYTPLADGVEASFQLQPFLLDPPQNYRPPQFRPAGQSWDLDAGLYVMTVRAPAAGVATLELAHGSGADGGHAEGSSQPRLAEAQLGAVELDSGRWYSLMIPPRPGVRTGAVLRPLPLDLTRPLPVLLLPNQPISLDVRADQRGVVTGHDIDGSGVSISLDQGPWSRDPVEVAPGLHTVALRSQRNSPVVVSVKLSPNRLSGSPPVFPDDRLSRLPDFPRLTAGEPVFFDLDRRQTAVYTLAADTPGLYRITTSGLLATSGAVRSRTIPELATDSGGGSGRNFLIQTYLTSGRYQLQLRAEGDSTGRTGLHLEHSPVVAGGELVEGSPARHMLDAGESIAYTFEINEPRITRLQSYGPGGAMRCRVDDADGWPVIRPGSLADLQLDLAAGSYRLIVLPDPVEHRLVTTIATVETPTENSGHGPHQLSRNQRIEHVWTEDPEARDRPADVWLLEMPAAATVTVEVSAGMMGRIIDEHGTEHQIAPIAGWRGRLAAGTWRVELRSVLPNNRLPYSLQASSEEMLAGDHRSIEAPATLDLSVGSHQLVRLWSSGPADVRAQLLDAKGQLVAANDDTPGDWNFELAAPLEPGRYKLEVVPVGSRNATSTITMMAPEAIETGPLAVPGQRNVSIHRRVSTIPIELDGPENPLLLATLSAAGAVGCTLERRSADTDAWQLVATQSGTEPSLAVPIDPGSRSYRLHIWAVDRRVASATLHVAAANPAPLQESVLARGIRLQSIPEVGSQLAVARVRLDRPGCFEMIATTGEVRWTSEPDQPTRPTMESALTPGGTTLWLVAEDTTTVQARRVRLSASRPSVRVLLEPTRTAFCNLDTSDGSGPQLITARSSGPLAGVAFSGASFSARNINTSSVVPGNAGTVTVAAEMTPAAQLWLAGPGPSAEVTVELSQWVTTANHRLPAGLSRIELPPGSRHTATVQSGACRLYATIEHGGVLAVSRDGSILSTVWADEHIMTLDATAAAGSQLLLFNPTGSALQTAIDVIPIVSTDAVPELSVPTPLEWTSVRSGTRSVAVAPGDGLHHLQAPGVHQIRFVGADGQLLMTEEASVPITAAGTALVESDAGRTQLWLDPNGAPGVGLWGNPSPAGRIHFEVPSSTAISGSTVTATVGAPPETLLHLRSTSPVVARAQWPDGREQVTLHPNGLQLDLWSPGELVLQLRPVATGQLDDVVEVTASSPTVLGEGLGPQQLLAAGSAAAFTIPLDRTATIGIGVRSTAGEISATLLDADGAAVGAGTAQMPELGPGRWTLLITTPTPALIQPVVVGLEDPGVGPPEAVLRTYLGTAIPEGDLR